MKCNPKCLHSPMPARWTFAEHGSPATTVIQARTAIAAEPGASRLRSAEGERVRLHAGLRERELEGAVGDGTALSDELIQPGLHDLAEPPVIDVCSVVCARRFAVYEHAERHGRPRYSRSHHDIEIARVETVSDAPVGGVQPGGLFADGPVSGQR